MSEKKEGWYKPHEANVDHYFVPTKTVGTVSLCKYWFLSLSITKFLNSEKDKNYYCKKCYERQLKKQVKE